jgi:hypothetical protein
MLDMLGEDARAAVGKVKQLQSQGATPDQVQAQMMEAARNGLLPISVAFAAQKALQRKNPPSPPPQGTVMSDMLGQLQDPREQGIAGLDNPVMDNAQYAGGGIVAFDTGGGLPLSTSRTRPNVFAGGPEARAAAAAEAERLAKAAAKGTATPPQLKRLEQLKALLKEPLSKVSARPGVVSLVKGSALTGAGLGALEGAAELNAIDIDELRAGQAALRADEEESPLSNIDPNLLFNPVGSAASNLIGLPALNRKVEDYLMEPAETSFGQAVKDTALRLGAFGKHVATRSTANLLGGSPLDYREAPAAAAAAAKPEEEKIDPTGLNLDYEQKQRAAGGDRYAGIQLPSQVSGIRAGYEAARKAVGPTDEASVGDEQSYIDKQGKITEKYELDKPLKAQQTKITERRAKLDEDYSKSTLTDLGLAFLTKGVMAAGEGKDTFSAMAYAVGEGAKTTKERRERIDQIREKLDDREAMLETQLATMRENQVTRGLAARDKELGVIRDNKNKIMALSLEEVKSLLAESGRQQDAALRVALARIQASGDADKIDSAERLSREYISYSNDPNRQREAAYTLQRLAELNRTGPQYLAAQAKLAQEAKERDELRNPAGAQAGGTQTTSSGTRYTVEN